VLLDSTRAVTRNTGVSDEAAGAVTFRAGLLNREEPLLQANLTAALAGRAGLRLRTGLGTAAMAGVANLHRRNANLGFRAEGRLLEGDFEVVAQIGAAVDIGTPATASTTTEDLVKDAAEGVGESARPAKAPMPACGSMPA
jgi:hypothetical protein